MKKDYLLVPDFLVVGVMKAGSTTLPILLIIFLFPSSILSFFGEEFILAKYSLLILAFSQTVNSMSGSAGLFLI